MCSREKKRRRRREHEEKMEGRVVIQSYSFACDGHCSVRSMKTHKQSKQSHLTSPSGRSSRTSSTHRLISAREKAMVVNLEFIKAIVIAKEVLLLDPLYQEVLPFVDQLWQQLRHKSVSKSQGGGQMDIQDNEMQLSSGGQWLPIPEAVEGLHCDLPFEFQVLEIALKVVYTYLDSSVVDLERNAYPVLDELVRNVSTKNLEHVRSLKSNLTSLLAWVQKVCDEIEHLLDDNEDMAHLYLTRKWIQSQQFEAYLAVHQFWLQVVSSYD